MPELCRTPYTFYILSTCIKFQTSRPNLMGAREFLVCGVTGVPEPLQLSPIGQIVPIALTHYCVMLPLTTGLSGLPVDVKGLIAVET